MPDPTSFREDPRSYGRHRPALADRVATEIMDAILQSNLGAGEGLPSEREMGMEYGVSRSVVREAVRSLAAKGVVDVGVGRRPQVAETDPAVARDAFALFLQRRRLDYDLVHEVRLLLEVHVAALAARRATDLDVDRISEALDRMRSAAACEDLATTTREDLAFHRAIALAAHNEIYPLLLDSISDFLAAFYEENLESGYSEQALEEHQRILASIADHDAAGARSSMSSHLEAVARNLQTVRLEEASATVAQSQTEAFSRLTTNSGGR